MSKPKKKKKMKQPPVRSYAGKGTVYGVDPATGPDRAAFLTVEMLQRAMESTRLPRAGWAGYAGGRVNLVKPDIDPPADRSRLAFGTGANPHIVSLANADFSDLERRVTAGLATEAFESRVRDDRTVTTGRLRIDTENYSIQAFGAALAQLQPSMTRAAESVSDFGDAIASALAGMAPMLTLDSVPQLQAKTRAQIRKPDHPDTGKVIRRPTRSYAGLLIEEVRQADGSVARRIRTNPPK